MTNQTVPFRSAEAQRGSEFGVLELPSFTGESEAMADPYHRYGAPAERGSLLCPIINFTNTNFHSAEQLHGFRSISISSNGGLLIYNAQGLHE